MTSPLECVRCGHWREEHHTNLVCQTEKYLAEIGAEEVFFGYEISLLTCSDTPRPDDYTKLVLELSGTTPPQAIGHGAGYVSPDPAAEIEARLEYNSMVAKTTLCFPYGFGGPVVDISG